jgi:hypothetical protein
MDDTGPELETSREQLRALLRHGRDSGPGSETGQGYFDRLRAWIRADGG